MQTSKIRRAAYAARLLHAARALTNAHGIPKRFAKQRFFGKRSRRHQSKRGRLPPAPLRNLPCGKKKGSQKRLRSKIFWEEEPQAQKTAREYQTMEKGCRSRTYKCEGEGVYTDINDRSPRHAERARDAPLYIVWCGRQDLNLQGHPPEPKSGASANSATPA